ncbi:MAG: energy transducer TonB [Bacteroidales bacterium]
MKDKEKDKRLLVPKDAFEEEASEGLGRLSREEAEADLRELKGRMERRLRKPLMIWLPAAAAVVILLVASALYVSIFRDRGADLTDLARAGEAKTDSALVALAEDASADTALIAMATPIEKKEMVSVRTGQRSMPGAVADASEQAPSPAEMTDVSKKTAARETKADEKNALPEVVVTEDEVIEVVAEVQQEEAVAEEVIVEAIPMMQKAALRSDDAAKDKAVARSDAARPAAATQGALVPDRSALPVGGWEEYREWIARNIRYPGRVDPVAREVIVVTFRVRSDSTIYDMKAERTSGDLFTREAFRLIREGPKWQPAVRGGQPVEEEVRVSIVFK